MYALSCFDRLVQKCGQTRQMTFYIASYRKTDTVNTIHTEWFCPHCTVQAVHIVETIAGWWCTVVSTDGGSSGCCNLEVDLKQQLKVQHNNNAQCLACTENDRQSTACN